MKKMTPEDLLLTLTEREKDVLRLVCQHKRYQEIAEVFFISEGTVRTHMFNIYASLELKDLDRDERVLKIHNIYCPLIQKQSNEQKEEPEIEIIDVTPEPEPISPEEEQVINGDEMALVAYKQEPITGGNKKMGTKKKRGCARFIITLILGALMVIGAWYSWENYLKDLPIVQSIVQLINPDAVIDSSPSAPSSSSSSSSSPSNSNSSNSSSSDSESIIEKILPKPDPYADAYDMGDWAKKDDVWVRLFDYEVARNLIRLDFEVWNKSGKDIFFSWEAEKNFSMTDNQNNRYEIFTDNPREVQVESDERLEITGYGYETVAFKDDSLYKTGVTDLYLKMEYFSTIDEAIFHIAVGN
jgi:hypothetical protein